MLVISTVSPSSCSILTMQPSISRNTLVTIDLTMTTEFNHKASMSVYFPVKLDIAGKLESFLNYN